MTQYKKSCVVVGAGIVGLSTAVCMQRAGFSVTIIADRFDCDTTSHVAGGVLLPYNRDVLGKHRRKDAVDVVKRSWSHYKTLWEASPTHSGVIQMFGYQCYFTHSYGEQLPETPLVWEVLENLRALTNSELQNLSPHSPCSGWLVQTYIIQSQYYLPYLMGQFKAAGGKVIQKHIKSFNELPDCDVVLNCCGLGAPELCGDKSVFPSQGQVGHAIAPHVKNFFHCEEVYYKPPEERQLLYILPQTNHVVVGGTYTEHSDTTLCSDEVKEEYMSKLCYVVPSLKNCEIIKEQCGVRPCRDVLRLEKEIIYTAGGRQLEVVHNYGHGGNGIALSWGTAELAAEIAVRTVMQKSKL